MRRTSQWATASPWPAVVFAVLLGGASPVLSKYLLRTLSVEALLTWRYWLSLLVLLPLLVWPRRQARSPSAARAGPRPSGLSYFSLACVAILGSGVGALLFTSSLQFAPAAVSNALSKTGPLFVAFLAYLLLDESVSLGSIGLLVAMLLAAGLLGAGEVAQPLAAAPLPLLGVVLAVAAGLTRAIAQVAAKSSLTVWPATSVAAARFLGGAVLAMALGLARPGTLTTMPSGASQWLALLTLAWLCTALPVALYYWGMARLRVHVASGVRTTGAVVTAIASWAALGEKLNVYHLLGIGALLLAAYAMASLPEQPDETRRRTRPGPVRAMLQFVTLIVAASVLATGLLQAWQLHTLLQRQVQATLGRTAALMGEVVALGDSMPRAALRKLVQRVVDERISTPGYTAEFAYLVVTDAGGAPVAWAFRSDYPVGWDARPDYEKARALAHGETLGGPARNLVPAHVTVVSDGVKVGDLYVGYRASVAWWPLFAVLARTGLLAALLAVLSAMAVSRVVRAALGPLAAVAASLRSQVEADGPGDDRQVASSSPDLDAAGEALLEWLASGQVLLPGVGPGACVVCCVRGPEGDARWPCGALAELAEQEGRLAGVARGWLVARWGEGGLELDDPLRAFVWAAELPALAALLSVPQGGDWSGVLEDLARAEEYLQQVRGHEGLGDASSGGLVLATAGFVEAAGEHLSAERVAEDLYLVKLEQS